METKEHHGHTITLTDRWTFDVAGPLVTRNGFASRFEAENEIDKATAAHAKQQKAANATSIPVLDDSGERINVRGIHSGQGGLLGVKDSHSVYPDHPAIREKLKRQAEIRAENIRINGELQAYRITVRRTHGRVNASEYDELVKRFEQELQDKTNLAAAKFRPQTVA